MIAIVDDDFRARGVYSAERPASVRHAVTD